MPTASIFSSCRSKNDSINGWFESWYENGQMEDRTHYINGIADGLSTSWFSNGQMEERVFYSNKKMNGIQELWNRYGVLISRKMFVNGVLQYYLPIQCIQQRQYYHQRYYC